MAEDKINARDWVFQVEDTTPATWLDIAGVETWKRDPTADEETATTVDINSGGQWEGRVMQRGGELELTGFRVSDTTTGDPNAGQARCDALAAAVGTGSRGKFRFRYGPQDTWVVWSALFSGAEEGGGTNDPTSWGVKVKKTGAASSAAVIP